MARIARIIVPGLPHHVTHRGNRQQDVFLEPSDREVYKEWLADYCLEYGLEIWCYCLMTNHVHLLVVGETEESMPKAIGRTHGRFSLWQNRRNGWSGHLWGGRYYSAPLGERHLWATAKYIELNPVRAGLCDRAEDYEWSSARAHAEGLRDSLLSPRRPFPGSQKTWSSWLADDPSPEDLALIRENTWRCRPIGTPAFVSELEEQLSRTLRLLPAGRPVKE